MAYLRHNKFIKKVGENVRRIRLDKKISQEQLSYMTEISINQISRIECGTINTGISTLYEIATALNVDVTELVTIKK